MTNFPALLGALTGAGVEYIVIGGAAATAHGSARLTLDLDVVYRRTPDNIARVAESVSRHHPYLRGAPPGLPFHWDAETIRHGLNFTLMTDLGAIDFREKSPAAGATTRSCLIPTRSSSSASNAAASRSSA